MVKLGNISSTKNSLDHRFWMINRNLSEGGSSCRKRDNWSNGLDSRSVWMSGVGWIAGARLESRLNVKGLISRVVFELAEPGRGKLPWDIWTHCNWRISRFVGLIVFEIWAFKNTQRVKKLYLSGSYFCEDAFSRVPRFSHTSYMTLKLISRSLQNECICHLFDGNLREL
jgi:hypothetical protein